MKKTYKIAVLAGDGIGPEVVDELKKVLAAVTESGGPKFEYTYCLAGGAAIDATGLPMPQETIEICKASDAVLLGAVGGPKWDALTGDQRPESGLLLIRKELKVFANIRPASVPLSMAANSPLRPDVVGGSDLVTFRELIGGIYFGQPVGNDGNKAFNTMVYEKHEIERIARKAFELARKRRNKVTSVDKANVLEVSRLWRDTVKALHEAEFKDVELEHMYIDNATMQMVINPRQFDVILTGNIFGDILSDTSATLGGSLGLLPSSSVGGDVGLYEPVHGSAPEIAGQNKANPTAMILSGAMMLDDLEETEAAAAIRKAVEMYQAEGNRTSDLWMEGNKLVGCSESGDIIANNVAKLLAT